VAGLCGGADRATVDSGADSEIGYGGDTVDPMDPDEDPSAVI
jgi:hypothetical protein